MRGHLYFFCSAFMSIIYAVSASADDRSDCDVRDSRAIAACSRVIALGELKGASLATVFLNRGAAYRRNRDVDRAIADYNEAIRLNPKFEEAFNLRGVARVDKGEFRLSIDDFAAAIRINPKNFAAYTNRGENYAELGDLDRAIADYSKAIALNPTSAKNFHNRGFAYRRKQDFDRAIADYSEAIRLRPDYPQALYNRAGAYTEKRDLDRAIADYDEAVRLDPTKAMFFNNRAHAHNLKRNFDLAIENYTQAMQIEPKNIDYLGNRGMLYHQKGDFRRAIEDFTELLKLEPKHVKVSALLEQSRRALAKAEAAATAASPAPVSQPGKGAALTVARGKRVALVIGNGRYEAIQQLTNPPNDAQDVAKALERLGFAVSILVDAKRAAMEDALAAFAREARQADTALVFYAGHGLQHQGVNYLAPVDARMTDETDLRKFVRVQNVLEDLQNGKGVRILILDACRDNEAIQQLAATLPKSRSATVRGGLASEKAEGVIIAYATQPDRVAADGDGRNSPFTAALLKNLPTPGVELRTMFTRVRAEVLRTTGGAQRPETSDSLDGEVVLSTP
jgi:tetratricopeptide (TPR) repeat protein